MVSLRKNLHPFSFSPNLQRLSHENPSLYFISSGILSENKWVSEPQWIRMKQMAKDGESTVYKAMGEADPREHRWEGSDVGGSFQ